MREIQLSAKTEEKAIEEAINKLNVRTAEELDIEILEKASKGFLGFGSKDAVIKATVKFNPEKAAKEFLREMFVAMGIIVNIDTNLKDKHLFINLSGDDMGVLIGKRGQTLDAIQYLTSLVVNKDKEKYTRVVVDAENYRSKREKTLEALAQRLATKVVKTRKSVKLEPMNPYERKVIHATLQNHPKVVTRSEGQDPYRRVMIELK
jgi:spoIIIJ-associated protein